MLATLVRNWWVVALRGVFTVIGGLLSRGENQRWWVVLLQGIAGIILGLLTFFYPNETALALLYLIAAWALITGIFEIVAGIMLRRVITGEWLAILNGILSVIFGVVLVVFPGAGALSLLWLIGTYAIILGILLIVLAFRLRTLREDVEEFEASRAARM
jgi:uncharacterized membrane protein HdeD (DUF308 family)